MAVASRREQILEPRLLDKLVARSDARGLSRLFQQLGALAVCGYLYTVMPIAIAWVFWIGYSIILIFSFCPLHESIHGSAFATRKLNQITGFVAGLVLLLPPRFFNVFHMAHHRHTQLPGKDPELAVDKPASVWSYLRYVSGIPYWVAQLRMLARYAIGRCDDFVPESRCQSLINEARVFLLIYGLLLLFSVVIQSAILWWFWLLPVLVAQPALRLFLLAEHTGCPEVPEMLNNTRTTNTNPLMRWLCWNMNHHTAHHAYAGIPFFRLQEASGYLGPHLVYVEQGYLRFHWKLLRSLLNRTDQPAI